MTGYESNITLAQAAKVLAGQQRILVTAHAKPDGDAFGSVVALAAVLTKLGKQVHALLMPPVPGNFTRLPGHDLIDVYDPSKPVPAVDQIVLLDTGAWSQIEPMRQIIHDRIDQVMIVDHHLSGDVPAALRYIDGQAGACCEVVAELIAELGSVSGAEADALLDHTVSSALFVGLVSDTGWFRFSNTRPKAHDLAARLLRRGVDHAELYSLLEQNERPQKLALMIRAVSSLKLLADGQAAMMVLRAEDFEQTGAFLEETERFVDIPQSVASVRLVVLITEPADRNQPIRLSFRSKPGQGAINVAELANQFGGGGHARAAGARAKRPIPQVIESIKTAVVAAVEK